MIGVIYLASVGGPYVGGIYSPYLILPVVVCFSRSPLIWRSAAGLGLVGAGTMVVFTVATGYPFDLLTLGALVAAAGSACSLFTPIDDLRTSPGPFGPGLRTRLLAGLTLLVASESVVLSVGIDSGSV